MTTLAKQKAGFYVFSLLDDFMPIYPLYAVMFTGRGVGAAELSALLFTWGAITFLLEVPSGAVADRYPRKYVLMFAQATRALGFLVWLAFPSFLGFLIGFMLWGVKSAFTSGTRQALVFDLLTAQGAEHTYTKVAGRMASLKLIGNAAATFLAVAFVATGYDALLLLSIGFSLANICVLATLPRTVKQSTLEHETHYFDYLKGGVQYALTHRPVLRIIAVASIVLGFGALDEHYGVFFDEIGLSDHAIAVWTGVLLTVGVAVSLLAHRFARSRLLTHGHTLAFVVALWGVALMIASYVGTNWAPFVIVLFGAFFFLIQTLSDGWLQRTISIEARATVTSVEGFVAELGALTSYVVVGIVAELTNYATGIRAMAIVIILAALATLVIHVRSARVNV